MAKVISKETMLVGILAVAAGLAAAYGTRVYLTPEEVEEKTPVKAPNLVKVLLAGTDLPADHVVNAGDIIKMSMARKKFDKRFKGLDPEEVIINASGIINRRLQKPIKQGQPFLTGDFYLHGTGPNIAKKLEAGYRAIRVEVSGTHEAGVQTGMFVDVLFRAKAKGGKEGQPAIPEKTLTLLRHIEVIDADRLGHASGKKEPPPKSGTLFTLAVPEDKVDIFGVIEDRGEVWLVPTPLKGNPDTSSMATVSDASTLAELLGLKPRVKQKPFETAIYRRGSLKVNKFMNGKLLASHSLGGGIPYGDQPEPSERPIQEKTPPAPLRD